MHRFLVAVSAGSVRNETLKSAVTEPPIGLNRTAMASLNSVELVRAWLVGLGLSSCEGNQQLRGVGGLKCSSHGAVVNIGTTAAGRFFGDEFRAVEVGSGSGHGTWQHEFGPPKSSTELMMPRSQRSRSEVPARNCRWREAAIRSTKCVQRLFEPQPMASAKIAVDEQLGLPTGKGAVGPRVRLTRGDFRCRPHRRALCGATGQLPAHGHPKTNGALC